MFYYRDRDAVIEYSGECSRTTHGATECFDACRYLGLVTKDGIAAVADRLLQKTSQYQASPAWITPCRYCRRARKTRSMNCRS